MKIRTLHVRGNSYEVGFQHGQAAAPEVKKNYEYYMSSWLTYSGTSEEEILNVAMDFIPHIQTLDADLVREMEGVAAGAQLRLSQIVALNARWELNYRFLPDMNYSLDGGCTAFALAPEATSDGHTYVGQNWDYKPPLQEQCLILTIEIPGRPVLTLLTEAGIIGHKGINANGIGVGVNFIKLKRDKGAFGIPFLLKARHVLELSDINACLGFMKDNPGPTSGNMMIASREGTIVDLECTPSGMTVLSPVKGALVHSNHFQVLEADDVDIGCRLLPDTFLRTQQLYRHFHESGNRAVVQIIEESLRDHSGFPNSICRHEDPTLPAAQRWQTLVSFYADLDTGKLCYTAGPPCLSDFLEYEY